MIQNDVLSTAAMEGRQEGLAEGRMEEKQAKDVYKRQDFS